jgi:uncharacterized RDD family membrane protein YckC
MAVAPVVSARCPSCNAPASEDAIFCESCGARLAASAEEAAPAGGFADFWTRLTAYILDGVIVAIGWPILVELLVGVLGVAAATVTLLAPPVYFWLGNSLGATPGKRIVGIAVVDVDGNRPGLARGLVRYVVSIASATAVFLGYLWMIWDDKRQTWHDKVAGTYVVPQAARATTISR